MKILLLGEYSNLHNSLKEGIIALGHEVTIVGTGDNFKKHNVDYSIHPSFFTNYWFTKKIKNTFHKVLNIDLNHFETAIRFYFLLTKIKNYNHVQFINSDALETNPAFSRFLYKKLFKNIKSRSLLVCGDETPIVDYLLKNELKYSILTPYLKDKSLKNEFEYTLKYSKPNYRKTFEFLKVNCQSIICSDIDYKIPMEKIGFKINFIPNPINTDKIEFQTLEVYHKIIIFLGINRLSYTKKGIVFFEKALEEINQKYCDKVEIICTENLPYSEYISTYNKCHILLDQVYGYDQGYNALEAMAKGKVVFTGAETEFLEYYNLQENEVCINALPDENDIVKKLLFLIENPSEINRISTNARKFIEKEHDYKINANKYLNVWETNSFLLDKVKLP